MTINRRNKKLGRYGIVFTLKEIKCDECRKKKHHLIMYKRGYVTINGNNEFETEFRYRCLPCEIANRMMLRKYSK